MVILRGIGHHARWETIRANLPSEEVEVAIFDDYSPIAQADVISRADAVVLHVCGSGREQQNQLGQILRTAPQCSPIIVVVDAVEPERDRKWLELGADGVISAAELTADRLSHLVNDGVARSCGQQRRLAAVAAVVPQADSAAVERDASAPQLDIIETAKDDFITTANHALRTPLTVILGFSELLLSRRFAPEKHEQYVRAIFNEAAHLSQIVGDLLRLDRHTDDPLPTAPIQIRDVVCRAAEPFLSVRPPSATFLFEIPDDLPPTMGDEEALQQALFHLLTNAVTFSPTGSTVNVRAAVENGMISVAVADRGLGIPRDSFARLFRRFSRLESGDRTHLEGAGLGLAVVKRIATRHGGHVTVTSEAGVGSTFSIHLPICPDPATRPPHDPADPVA